MGKFQPIFAPGKTRHAFEKGDAGSLLAVFKSGFDATTFLLTGALLQCLAFSVLPFRYAITPTLFLVVLSLADTILQTMKITPNRHMKDVVPGRASAVLPSKDGVFSDKPAAEPIVVFLLGARWNHPLGPLAPHVKDMGEYFSKIYDYALANSAEFGLLGASQWDSATGLENASLGAGRVHQVMTVFYFRSVEGLHELAKSPEHVETVRWWSRISKDASNAHIGIMHETFSVPAGNWETIYENFQPTGMGALSISTKDQATGEEQWVRPLAAMGRKSVLRTMYGRMGRTDGSDNEKYADDGFY